jgi:hypothetical protein
MVPVHEREGDGSRDDRGLLFQFFGSPEGITPTRDEKTGQAEFREVGSPEPVRAARRMEGVADEHQGGSFETLGDGDRAHPATHGPSPQGDQLGRDAEPSGQLCGRCAHHLDADRGWVRPTLSHGPPGEFDSLHDDTERRDGFVDGDERRLIAPRTCTGGEHEAEGARSGHRAILAATTAPIDLVGSGRFRRMA